MSFGEKLALRDQVRALQASRQFAAAVVLLKAYSVKTPQDVDVLCLLSECAFNAGDNVEAMSAARAALNQDQTSNLAWHWLGRSALRAGALDQAEAAFEQAMKCSVSLRKISDISRGIGWINPKQLDVENLRFTRLSYSNAGHDQCLAKYLKDKLGVDRPGTYVDIGAHSAVNFSNTYFFYCLGWSGLCIDADQRYGASFAALRPRDRFVAAAIGELGQKLFYANHIANPGMGRVGADPDCFGADFFKPVPLNARSLGDILGEAWPDGQDIDFFTIDLEGAELTALRGNDWARFRPRLICIEDHTYRLGDDAANAAVSYLKGLGYRVDSKIHSDLILVDQNS